jgi:hypothetical protein
MLCIVNLCWISGKSDLCLENAHITQHRSCSLATHYVTNIQNQLGLPPVIYMKFVTWIWTPYSSATREEFLSYCIGFQAADSYSVYSSCSFRLLLLAIKLWAFPALRLRKILTFREYRPTQFLAPSIDLSHEIFLTILQRMKHRHCQMHVSQHKRFKFSERHTMASSEVP